MGGHKYFVAGDAKVVLNAKTGLLCGGTLTVSA